MLRARNLPRAIAERLLPAEIIGRVDRLDLPDCGHGFDQFGMNRDWIAFGSALCHGLYTRYFRVSSYGAHHIPGTGAAVLASNHSGTLPLDAMMIWSDVLRHSEPVRVVRPVVDHFVSLLPFVSTFFTRNGAIGGTRGNFHALLDGGELLLVFPEGTPGIGKRFSERYQLQNWRVGHAELAIRHGVPVIPVAVIGAEEQWPQVARIPGIRLFGAPYLPVPATPLPMPVHYHIHYGAPLPLHQRWSPAQADDPAVTTEAAAWVRDEVDTLLQVGLTERPGIFR